MVAMIVCSMKMQSLSSGSWKRFRRPKLSVISFDQLVAITPDGQYFYGLVAFQVVAQPVDINIHGFAVEHIVAAP
jgi:hypothetical protein